jgi:hypothetical protein
MGDHRAFGAGVDLAFTHPAGRGISYAFLIRNVIPTFIRWDTGTTEVFLPAFRLGAEKETGSLRVTTQLDVNILNINFSDYESDYRFGIEYSPTDHLILRTGSSTQYGLTIGLGVQFNGYAIDYVYIPKVGNNFHFPVQSVSLKLDLDVLNTLLNSVNP